MFAFTEGRMALAMKGVQMAKQANFAPAALQHFNYSTEVCIQRNKDAINHWKRHVFLEMH